ncbi:MAG: DHHW family protein [Lachnospiraceae bacterium]|nr:DHHW family protein [Lachnospiraceae bacterium]MEE3460336.1 DHHW family protein [Lachnospiraceae bacterium]
MKINGKLLGAVMLLSVAMLAGCGNTSGLGSTSGTGTDQSMTASSADGSTESSSDSGDVSSAGGASSSSDPESSSDNSESKDDSSENTDEETYEYKKIRVNARVHDYGNIVTVGRSGYELYSYVPSDAKTYAAVINKFARSLDGISDVYNILIPTSTGVVFPDNKLKEINSSDQKKAIDNIYGMIDDSVNKVPIVDRLLAHRTEYVYFRTDHHWTALGAYYAYQKYAEAAGLTVHDLSEYRQETFKGFTGSFSTDTKDPKLKADKVTAYHPIDEDQEKLVYTNKDNVKVKWHIISNGNEYSPVFKYLCFIGGDNPLTTVTNSSGNAEKDTCILVKESFGNCFAPFLFDEYKKVYIVDYRYYNGSVVKLAKKVNADDVIFLNNISMTRNSYLIGQLAKRG